MLLYEDALNRITFPERQLRESNDEFASLYKQCGSYDHLTTLSLRDQLAVQDRNLCSTILYKPQDRSFQN